MRSRAVFALFVVCMFGCSRPEPATQDPSYGAVDYPTSAAQSPFLTRIQVEARAPTDTIVVFRLELLNTGDTTVSLLLTDRPPAFDFRVTRADGSVVWQRLQSRYVRTVGTRMWLRPGESRTFVERWGLTDLQSNRVNPGTYQVRGMIYTDQGLSWTTAQPLTVTATGHE